MNEEMAFVKFALTVDARSVRNADYFDDIFAKIKANGESKRHSLITCPSFTIEPLIGAAVAAAMGVPLRIEKMAVSFQFDANGSCTGKHTTPQEAENRTDTRIGRDAGRGKQSR
jgi:hypothetical protein